MSLPHDLQEKENQPTYWIEYVISKGCIIFVELKPSCSRFAWIKPSAIAKKKGTVQYMSLNGHVHEAGRIEDSFTSSSIDTYIKWVTKLTKFLSKLLYFLPFISITIFPT